MKKGGISAFKVAQKAKFTVEVYSTTSTLHLRKRASIVLKYPRKAS